MAVLALIGHQEGVLPEWLIAWLDEFILVGSGIFAVRHFAAQRAVTLTAKQAIGLGLLAGIFAAAVPAVGWQLVTLVQSLAQASSVSGVFAPLLGFIIDLVFALIWSSLRGAGLGLAGGLLGRLVWTEDEDSEDA